MFFVPWFSSSLDTRRSGCRRGLFLLRVVVFKLTFVTINLSFFLSYV